jgi:hypothetical protein
MTHDYDSVHIVQVIKSKSLSFDCSVIFNRAEIKLHDFSWLLGYRALAMIGAVLTDWLIL